ncbi:LemA family protein [Candidatus Gracilibacteria bacterium]|nr:LemA family protein [Candidatus Gracilibacteria bacterium]
MPVYLIVAIVIAVYLFVYFVFFTFFRARLRRPEQKIIDIFLAKVAKIPSLIEVMRAEVVDEKAFDVITKLHSGAMIYKYDSIYSLLENNKKIHDEFGFLMKLSMQIPSLQKNELFVYIRDFIIKYERNMKKDFSAYNSAVNTWNTFVKIKNFTILGLILPGSRREKI